MGDGASHVQGVVRQQVLEEMGEKARVVITSDAAASLSKPARLGLGRVLHLCARAGFVRDAVRTRRVITRKVASAENDADLQTKHVDRQKSGAICTSIGMVEVDDPDRYKDVKLEKPNHFKGMSSIGVGHGVS